MKHKRHQKDRRDKNDRERYDDHRYYKSEHSARSEIKHYIMRDLSNHSGDENEPKKLIIYIVNIVLLLRLYKFVASFFHFNPFDHLFSIQRRVSFLFSFLSHSYSLTYWLFKKENTYNNKESKRIKLNIY
jgi:hypothetical protein